MTKAKEQAQDAPRVGDVVSTGFADFYPDAAKTEIEDVMEMGDVKILGCRIVEDFETAYGSHPFCVIAVNFDIFGGGDDIFTFPTSGVVIVRKMRELAAKEAFPIIGRFFKDHDKRYYDVK